MCGGQDIECREVRLVRRNVLPVLAAVAMAALILDGKTAVVAASDAVQLCIQVLIPSLFPFFVFSPLLASGGFGKLFLPLGRMLRLPRGTESILLVSFLGGYPVGAAVAAQCVRNGTLKKQDARRMMAFCSNAGPSFLFGIGLSLFPSAWYCWVLWGIHILSAVAVGIMTPGGGGTMKPMPQSSISLPGALRSAIGVMGTVCGWVVLFRILIGFLDRWLLWAVPQEIRIALCGALELANGCSMLADLENTGLRMLLFSGMLSFGGLCVWLQTRSVTQGVDTALYLPGKAAQAACSILLTSLTQLLLPQQERIVPSVPILLCCAGICAVYPLAARKMQNRCRKTEAVGV